MGKRKSLTGIITLILAFIIVSMMCFSGCNKTEPNHIIVAVARDQSSEQNQLAQEKCLNEYIEAFKLQNPDIKVEIRYMNALPADTDGYDCVIVGADSALAYIAEDLADLSGYMGANGVNENDLLSSALSLGRFGDKAALYYLPFNYDRAVIYADTALLEQGGVALPSNDWTYSDLENMLEELTYRKGITRYCGIYMPYYMPFVWQYYCNLFGGGWYNGTSITFGEGDANEALMKMLDVYQDGFARAYRINQKGSGSAICAMSMTYACMPERNGVTDETTKASLANPGTNTETLLEAGTLRLLPLPSDSNGNRAGSANTEFIKGFAVFKNSEKKDNAAKFAMFSASPEGQRILNSYYGGIPVNKTLWTENFWKTGLLSGANADAVLVGIESDTRDDFSAVLDGDKDVFYKNIRLRTIFSALFIREFSASDASDRALQDVLEEFIENAQMTISSQVPSVS